MLPTSYEIVRNDNGEIEVTADAVDRAVQELFDRELRLIRQAKSRREMKRDKGARRINRRSAC